MTTTSPTAASPNGVHPAAERNLAS
ncbi:MAG: hypothetical protein QOG07_1358, partial [Pseudonocardiales bacterium]|nr:hypothetical protein [Pseudonocardiales bacterium]